MTIYRPKYTPSDKYVNDADKLMMEFNRAEYALRNLDHNNFKLANIQAGVTTSPSLNSDPLTVTHKSGSLFRVEGTSPKAFSSTADELAWINLSDGTNDMEAEITLARAADVEFIFSGEYTNSGSSANVAIRVLADGKDTGVGIVDSLHLASGTVYLPVFLHGSVRLGPGDHILRVQVNEWDNEGGTMAEMLFFAWGYTR